MKARNKGKKFKLGATGNYIHPNSVHTMETISMFNPNTIYHKNDTNHLTYEYP